MPPPAGEISAAIEIAATPERVWAVLTDLASYPQWNPVFREASGQVAVGNRITLTSTQPVTGHTMTVKVKVLTAEPATELRWVSSVLGLMSSKRSFTLSPANGGTQLRQTQTLLKQPKRILLAGLAAGALSVLAYGLVLWAQTRGALAPIAALRETSVIFGAIIGTLIFREPFGRSRIAATVLVATGIVLLNFS